MTADIRAALDVLEAVYSAADLEQVPPVLAAALAEAVPHDYLVWGDVRTDAADGIEIPQLEGSPAGVPLAGIEALRGYLLAHPGNAVQLPHRQGSPVRWSDVITPAQHRRVPYYSEVIAPMGAEHGVQISLPGMAGQVYCVTIGRSRSDFTDRDLAVLTALRPFLARRIARLATTRRELDILTSREATVLALVSQGLTNYQIARRLGTSPRTVAKHLEHILAKLNAPSRAAAAARYTLLQANAAAPARAPGRPTVRRTAGFHAL